MRKVLISTSITLIILLSIEGFCQNPTDHFRSKQTGSWESQSTWEFSIDGKTWTPASTYPTCESKTITIRSPHIITQDNALSSADELTIESNATLKIQKSLKLSDGVGDDLIVYGTIHILGPFNQVSSSTIIIKNGGKYLADISKNNQIYTCIWEDGSTLKLENLGNKTTITNLSQCFYNLICEGSSQTNDITLNLTDDFHVNNNFVVESTYIYDIILTASSIPVSYYVDGNLELRKRSSMHLSSGIGPVTLTIGGNLNIGTEPGSLAALFLGSETNTGNIINLAGDLNINTSGGINPNTSGKNGTLCFIDTSNTQVIENIYGRINHINYLLNQEVAVSSDSIRIDPGYSLKLKNNASLITNSISVPVSVDLTVANADWALAMDGWHLISSPVSGQSVATGGFTWPFGDLYYNSYDFYGWNEPQNQWLNQKVPENGITYFAPGTGYLVAYDEGGTKTFTGTLNNSSISRTNLSFSGTSAYGGFHLLGNPFPCALNWSHAAWIRNNVSDVASVWNETAMNYLPVTEINPNITSNQGFFIQVSAPTNSLVIPVEAKVHNNLAFNKRFHPLIESPGIIYLRVTDISDSTYDETIIRLRDEALPRYDLFDGHKLTGSDRAPQLYTEIAPGENASVNTFPVSDPPETVPLFFKPGFSDSHKMEVLLNSMDENVFLEDLLTGQIIELNDESSFSFSASPQDKLRRFILHLGPVGVPEVNQDSFSLYSYDRNIYIRQTADDSNAEVIQYRVLCIAGSVVAQGSFTAGSLSVIPMPNAPPGIYLISLSGETSGSVNKKIVLF